MLLLLLLSLSCAHWIKLHQGGGPVYSTDSNALLSGRRNSAIWIQGDNIYVLAGRTDIQRVNDFWKYEINTNRWLWQPNVPTSFSIRSGSSHWVMNGMLWLYGGRNDLRSNYTLDDFWSYNPTTREWKRYNMNPNPGPRFGSAFWKDEVNNHIYIFAGKNDNLILRDLWRFDVLRSSWEQIFIQGLEPQDDSIATIIEDEVFIFGETQFLILNLRSLSIINVINKGVVPPKRADSVLWSHSQHIYLFGGRTESRTYGDFWRYDILKNEWEKRNDTVPQARWGSAFSTNRNMEVFVFGGQIEDSTALSNDLWMFSYTATGTGTTNNGNGTSSSIIDTVYQTNIGIITLSVLNFCLLLAFMLLCFAFLRKKQEVSNTNNQQSNHDFSVTQL